MGEVKQMVAPTTTDEIQIHRTITQTAKILGVHRTKVRQLIKDGELPAINLSGEGKQPAFRIGEDDIRAYIRRCRAA